MPSAPMGREGQGLGVLLVISLLLLISVYSKSLYLSLSLLELFYLNNEDCFLILIMLFNVIHFILKNFKSFHCKASVRLQRTEQALKDSQSLPDSAQPVGCECFSHTHAHFIFLGNVEKCLFINLVG